MTSLGAYQNELKALLFFREGEPQRSVVWDGNIPKRLEVYRNNTRTNWMDTLGHDFQLTRQQFTPEAWESLAKRFFVEHPPQHWELNQSMAPFPLF